MAGHIYSEDAEIFYDTRGEGPPLVLLHPFPSNRDFWNPVAAQFACNAITRLRRLPLGSTATKTGNG